MENFDKQAFNDNLRQTLKNVKLLPPLPETARKLLKLRNTPNANLEQLTSLIEKDPSLAVLIMKYARMAIFGYGNKIISVRHAVTLALGFNTALNITIGIASAGSLKLPNHGPLGRVRIWGQALECAALCRELSKIMTNKKLIDTELAYLGGLFHNFGYLLLGHLRPKQFNYLNDLASCYPEQDVRTLELQTFGITHETLGMNLIKAWDLPEEIATAVAEHHFPDYGGKHAAYAKLVAISNRLLQHNGMVDVCHYIETPVLLEGLGINELEALSSLAKVRDCQSEFNALANEMAA